MRNFDAHVGFSCFCDKKDISEQVLTGVELNGHLA